MGNEILEKKSGEEKREVMSEFREGKFDFLVVTETKM